MLSVESRLTLRLHETSEVHHNSYLILIFTGFVIKVFQLVCHTSHILNIFQIAKSTSLYPNVRNVNLLTYGEVHTSSGV